MHTVFALLCFVVVIHWLIFPYPSGLLHWHCGNLTIAPVPAKQPWWIWINTSCEFIMNDCITTTKQSTTKPCAYFLGYTVCYVYATSDSAKQGASASTATVLTLFSLNDPVLALQCCTCHGLLADFRAQVIWCTNCSLCMCLILCQDSSDSEIPQFDNILAVQEDIAGFQIWKTDTSVHICIIHDDVIKSKAQRFTGSLCGNQPVTGEFPLQTASDAEQLRFRCCLPERDKQTVKLSVICDAMWLM